MILRSRAAPALERVGADSSSSPIWAEHRSRYKFAAAYVQGATVLDIACGDGWGGPIMLAGGARSVAGVDASPKAVEKARLNRIAGLSIERGDATALPLPNDSIDVAVSFETLEHIEQDERFLEELRRVIGADGLLLLSTPNALHSLPVGGVPRNRFHVREYTPAELGESLRAHFASVELRGQRVHPSLRPCPYWERPEVRSDNLGERSRSLLWKLLTRFPRSRREKAAERLLGHPLFPGEDDFVFDPNDVEGGHVLVAVCRP